MFILFLMMLCTTYGVHGMEAILDQKNGVLSVVGFDQIYSNNATDDGKGGITISSESHPLCLIAQFTPQDPKYAPENLMLPIEGITPRDIADNTQVSFVEHKTRKKINLIMCPLLREKLQEALGK